jgi:murein DD-endopeptidase MepM/ murein hydrolase activator NlpD
MATAAGTVVFAGRKGHFGRLVEIDHGNGIRTRYGHLRKILAEPGQELSHREEVGLLGSSGRSTGPHVHYEILVDGEPRNPADFMTAGHYGFKG